MAEPLTVYVTPARMRVLAELLADGASNRQIASRLELNIETVRSHLTWLYHQTGTQDRASLVVAILRSRIRIVRIGPKQKGMRAA